MSLSLSLISRWSSSSLVRRPAGNRVLSSASMRAGLLAMPNYSDWTDEDLLERGASGVAEAFRTLFERHNDRVLGIMGKYIPDVADQEDQAQETWVRVMRFAAGFNRQKGRFTTWLDKIAQNVSIGYFRKRHPDLWEDFSRSRSPLPSDDSSDRSFDPKADDSLSPESVSGLDFEYSPDLHECLRRLPPDVRELLVLCFEKEMSPEDLVDFLGVSRATISNLRRKGLRTVQWCMKQKGYALSEPNVRDAISDARFAVDLIKKAKSKRAEESSYDLIAWCTDSLFYNKQVCTSLNLVSGARRFTLTLNRRTADGLLYGDEVINSENGRDFIDELAEEVVLSIL